MRPETDTCTGSWLLKTHSMQIKHYFLVLSLFFAASEAFAQGGDRKDKTAVTYEEIYDEPYSINKLFVQFQPFYGELFVTNVNAGFGLEASYYHADKFDFKAQFRKSYSQKFYDFARDLAIKNSDVDNDAAVFNYFELGATYHFRDFESSSKTKMFLYKKSYRGSKWAARVPLSADVPCKVRKIYGGRIGAIAWKSSVDLSRVLDRQDLTNADLKDAEGNGLPDGIDVFSNISSMGGYIGASITNIKNVAVDFDKFEEGIDDLIFTAYFDILFAPSLKLDEIVYTSDLTRKYNVDAIKTKPIGFRLGIEGKFNRTLGWAYGGELGYRPSVQGSGFYALLKISFPVFSTDLDYKVESFGK